MCTSFPALPSWQYVHNLADAYDTIDRPLRQSFLIQLKFGLVERPGVAVMLTGNGPPCPH